MMDRRELVLGAFGLSSGMALSTQMANADSLTRYEHAVHSTWAPMRVEPRKLELVRFATLAANSHNTQPWKFSIKDSSISMAPDYARRCPIVDPDGHHLFVSLGCATENLMHAAAAAGLKSNPLADVMQGRSFFDMKDGIPLRDRVADRFSRAGIASRVYSQLELSC